MLPVPPPPAAHRIVALDVLRGFALCGILLVNVGPVTSFGHALEPTPVTLHDPSGWLQLFVQQRFFPIFSVLFGAGFSLVLAAAARHAVRPRVVLLRRLLALLALGLVHQLWHPGEALTVYAAVGLLVLLPSTWLPRPAVAVGAVVLTLAALGGSHGGLLLVPGMILAGSALARYGVVDRLDRPGTHVEPFLLALTAAAGAALVWQVHDLAGSGFSTSSSVAGLLLACVYATTIVLALQTRVGPVLQAAFAPLGRLSLTHYVTATAVLVVAGRVLDLPHGRSWGRVLGLAVAILVVQWVFSTLWLRRFRHGPLECLWRWATWGRRDALRLPSLGRRAVEGTARAGAATAAVALIAAGCAVGTGTGVAASTTDAAPAVPIVVVAATDTPRLRRAARPEDVLLPDEGQHSRSPEFTDWTTDDTLGRRWLLDPCRPTAYPTDTRRTSFRTVVRRGPEVEEARQLAVYPSSRIADDAVAGFRRTLAACRTGGWASEGNRWQWVTADAPDLGNDGFVAASTVGGPGFSATGDRIAVTRQGSAVFLAYVRGEYTTAQLDDGTRAARDVARAFLASLGSR